MSKAQAKRAQREKWLREWLEEGGYGLAQLIEMLNGHLAPAKAVSERTVDGDIQRIRAALRREGRELRHVGGTYHIERQVTGPVLVEDEKRMVPLVEKLLQPFRFIPGIQRIQGMLRSEFDVQKRDLSVVQNAVTFTSTLVQLDPRVQELALSLLEAMLRGEAIAFHYRQVPAPNREDRMHLVYPLQIRESTGRFYLVSIPVYPRPDRSGWEVHALDEFRDMRILPAAPYMEPSDLARSRFDYRALVSTYRPDAMFQHAVGIWREALEGSAPQRVVRYFAGWAITHLKACPIHPSQVIVARHSQVHLAHLDPSEGPQDVAQVAFTVHDTPELHFRFGAYRAFSWSNKHGIHGPGYRYNWD